MDAKRRAAVSLEGRRFFATGKVSPVAKRKRPVEPPSARDFIRGLIFVLLVLLMGTLVAIMNTHTTRPKPPTEVHMQSSG